MIRLAELFITSDKIHISPPLFYQDDVKRRLLITLNMNKREFLDEWVLAVNEHGGFGEWQWAISKDPADISRILETAMLH